MADDVAERPTKLPRLDHDVNSMGSTSFTSEESGREFPNSFSSGKEFKSIESNIEEFKKLKEFQVLDEVGMNDVQEDDSDGETSDESEEIPDGDELEEELEHMLEEDLPEDFKGPPKDKEKAYVTRTKLLLEEKGKNHFDVLPLDWLVVVHTSGIPVYLNKTSRVCTLSRPYFLGKGSVRRHEIPVSAIPCLAYKRSLEEEEKMRVINEKVKAELNTTNTNNKETCPFSGAKMTEQTDTIEDTIMTDISHVANGIQSQNSSNEANKSDEHIFKMPHLARKKRTHNEESDHSNVNSGSSEDENVNVKTPAEEVISTKEVTASTEEVTASTEEVTASPEVVVPPSMKPVVLPGGQVVPAARIETMQENWKNQHLSHEQVTEYCRKLFRFKEVSIVHFRHWADRRRYAKAKKAMQRPTLPEGTKLISIPSQPNTAEEESTAQGILGRPKRMPSDWYMNMNGRSYVSVFHEYTRRALHKQPTYDFKQLDNSASPYEATVYIDGMRYGVGVGSSKRQAKSNAARESILILIPDMKDQINTEEESTRITSDEPDLAFFDLVGIEDPRIMNFCTTTMEPSPHSILRTCLLRNFGAGDRHIECSMTKLKHEKIEFHMTVGKHSASVVCKNKKIGKQRASQAILQALHPHVKSWGSLLRLYGSRSIKSCRDRKREEQEITLLQDKATYNQPNYAILEKLRLEMEKLNERDSNVVSLGTLVVSDDLPKLSGSGLDNVEL